jgi:alpha-beta hydrolase superfamily lysophospholipase
VKRLLVILATLLAATVICVLCAGWLLAHPVQTRIGNPPADLNAQAITFASDSDANVHGWWCSFQNARGAVLLLPGIRANRLSMVDRARFLRRAGYSVLLIDFQATGETKGEHITFGWKESRDVLAARNFVRQIETIRHTGAR